MQTRKVAADVKPTVAVVDGDLATLVIKHQAMSLRLNLVARNRGKRGMHTNLYEARRQRGRDSGCQCRDFKVYTRQLWKPSRGVRNGASIKDSRKRGDNYMWLSPLHFA